MRMRIGFALVGTLLVAAVSASSASAAVCTKGTTEWANPNGGAWTVIIRPDWKAWLLEDLVDDFGRVDNTRRRTHAHGRVAHFSYQPKGAPARGGRRRARRGPSPPRLGRRP